MMRRPMTRVGCGGNNPTLVAPSTGDSDECACVLCVFAGRLSGWTGGSVREGGVGLCVYYPVVGKHAVRESVAIARQRGGQWWAVQSELRCRC